MDLSYYTIDDVSLGPGRLFHRGWRLREHETLNGALAWYKALDPEKPKNLGLSDGVHTLDLVRCLKIYDTDQTGEDVLFSDPQEQPWWQDELDVCAAAAECITYLKLRYAVDGNILVPLRAGKKFPKILRAQRLWMGRGSDPFASVRRVLVARRGWVSAGIITKPHDPRPLVLKYEVDCIDAQGAYSYRPMEPWAYKLLAQQTLEPQKKEETKP